jgi:tetratricopeptide (TPR) repeat protein
LLLLASIALPLQAAASDSAEEHAALARAALARGDLRAAAREADSALALDSAQPEAHAILARLTGPAQEGPVRTPKEALERATSHPYDAAALAAAANALAATGRKESAVVLYEKVLWLADTNPAAAALALERLPELDPRWRERRTVPVHAFADETLGRVPGWEFQVRTALLTASNSLDNAIGVRFLAVSLHSFALGALDDASLESIHAAFAAKAKPVPADGILAGFTARPVPAHPGAWKLGIAELLGRRLSVRLPAGAVESRPLAHELLHLFGAVHVSGELDSLMNPDGSELRLDPFNLEIVRLTRGRGFSRGDAAKNVLPYVDRRRLIDAYTQLLRTNLKLRELGIEEILSLRMHSRAQAAARASQVRDFDPHLAEVAQLLGVLLVNDGRNASAVGLFEVAAALWGPNTEKGKENLARAETLRAALEAGAPSPPAAAPQTSPAR